MPKKKFSATIEDCLHNPYPWKLSEEFIRGFADKLNLENISLNQKLSESFLEELIAHPEFNERPDLWSYISYSQTLSEAFIDKYKDELSWAEICKHQKLSSAFMENHLQYLEFAFVSRYQKLDAEFVQKHFDKLDYDSLLKNKSHSPEVKKVLLKNAKKIVSSFL